MADFRGCEVIARGIIIERQYLEGNQVVIRFRLAWWLRVLISARGLVHRVLGI